eukprot:TRINITY_DN1941_c0_g2_i1.p1 TRINITY_DN1941_c0_g2~~TRINITY_DN1941_c0_g2_i1.p1  ORF type:complete len:777 (+),score=81.07 TRINITY_DN1941_c0_g2_i1:133-2463(+)
MFKSLSTSKSKLYSHQIQQTHKLKFHKKFPKFFFINQKPRPTKFQILAQQSNETEEKLEVDDELFSTDYLEDEGYGGKKIKASFYDHGERTARQSEQLLDELKELDSTTKLYYTKLNLLVQKARRRGEFLAPDVFTKVVSLAHQHQTLVDSESYDRLFMKKWLDRIQQQVNFLSVDDILDAVTMSCRVRRDFWQVSLEFMMERLGSRLQEVNMTKLNEMLEQVIKMRGRAFKTIPTLVKAIVKFLESGGQMAPQDYVGLSNSISLISTNLTAKDWAILYSAAFQHAPEMTLDQCVSILASFARSDHKSPKFLDQISEQVSTEEQLPLELTTQIYWILGRLLCREYDTMFDKLKEVVRNEYENLQPYQLLVVLWSHMRLKKFDEKFYDILAQRFVATIDQYKDLQLAKAAYGFGYFEYNNYGIYRLIGKQIVTREELILDPVGVQQILYGFAQSQYYNQEVLTILLDAVVQQKLDVYGTVQLVSVINLLAQIGHYDEVFLGIVQEDTVDKVRSAHAECAGGLLHAFVNLWFEPQFTLVDDLKQKIAVQRQILGLDLIVDLVWSLRAFQYLDSDLIEIFVSRLRIAQVSQFTVVDLRRLYHSHLVFKYGLLNQEDEEDSVWECLHPTVRKSCESMYKKQLKENRIISGFQKDVFNIIKSFGVECEQEFCVNDGEMYVDICISQGLQKFAVEVDGDSHYSRSKPYWELGHTRIRNRILKGMGFVVIQIPFFEWANRPSVIARRKYVLDQLKDRGVSVKNAVIDTGYTYDEDEEKVAETV